MSFVYVSCVVLLSVYAKISWKKLVLHFRLPSYTMHPYPGIGRHDQREGLVKPTVVAATMEHGVSKVIQLHLIIL